MTTLTIFDLDDTLLTTNAKTWIKTPNGGRFPIHSSNLYELKSGEEYDYSEYRNSKLFYDTAKPIRRMIKKYKNIINRKKETDKITIITARSDFDDKELFLSALEYHNVYHSDVHVYRAGNLSSGTTPSRKCTIISDLLSRAYYTKVRMFDDAYENLEAFLGLKKNYKGIKFHAFHVKENGDVSRLRLQKV